MRYMGWTMSLLPLPSDWGRARDILDPIGERAMSGTPVESEQLLEAVLEAYRMTKSDVEDLLSWNR